MSKAIPKYDGVNLLFCYYSYEDYQGEAFVLFEQDGKLFEVNGGHCSCYGLEGQWQPEETTLEAIEHRLRNGKLGESRWDGDKYASDLKRHLGFNCPEGGGKS